MVGYAPEPGLVVHGHPIRFEFWWPRLVGHRLPCLIEWEPRLFDDVAKPRVAPGRATVDEGRLQECSDEFRSASLFVGVGPERESELDWAADRAGKKNADSAHPGRLIASGLITGEALMGIMMAMPIAATDNPMFYPETFPEISLGPIVGLLVMFAAAAWIYITASKTKS